MVSALELIAAALAAGAGAGVTGVASTAVEDAYTQLKALLRRRPRAAEALDGIEDGRDDPATWQARLAGEDFDGDAEILAAARRLLDAARQEPKYRVEVQRSQGVQIGDGTVQHNVFPS